jgi:acetylornithine deacetylase/succinyl-diaminopimelate desuccinylase-like protein
MTPGELPRRAVLAAVPQDSDWAEIGRESAEILAQYLRINTTNPPGNEIAAARYLRSLLDREGIATQIFEPAPGKANLYARLGGDGTARPIVLLNHMDVVEASRDFWTVDPFGGVVQGGYVYGRGAIDMKSEGVAELMAVFLLKRSGVPLRRDVIFLATSDEEVGLGVGAGWIAEHHPELLQGAEFLINEGGSMPVDDAGNVAYVGIGATEKAPFWLALTARGTAGHGSRPTGDNAVERLIRALARVEAWRPPFVVTPATDRFFKDLAERERDPVRRGWYADVRAALRDSVARTFFAANSFYNAILRNTISVTRLAGSGKVNVIPPVARAELDVRLLPGQDPQRFLSELRRVVADTLVAVEPLGVSWPATESPVESDLVRAVRQVARRHFPGVLVTTPPLTGFTDSHFFRTLGIACYGLAPFPLSEADARGVHGNDERLSLKSLEFGTRFLFEILQQTAGQ